MTTICITIVICVAIICVTHIYPLLVERHRKDVDKAKRIISEVRKENAELRKQLSDNIDVFLEQYDKKDKAIDEILDRLLDLTLKIEKYEKQD